MTLVELRGGAHDLRRRHLHLGGVHGEAEHRLPERRPPAGDAAQPALRHRHAEPGPGDARDQRAQRPANALLRRRRRGGVLVRLRHEHRAQPVRGVLRPGRSDRGRSRHRRAGSRSRTRARRSPTRPTKWLPASAPPPRSCSSSSSTDTSTTRTDDYRLMRQVNDNPPEVIARNLLRSGSDPFFSYDYLGDDGSGNLQLMAVPDSLIPVRHTRDVPPLRGGHRGVGPGRLGACGPRPLRGHQRAHG